MKDKIIEILKEFARFVVEMTHEERSILESHIEPFAPRIHSLYTTEIKDNPPTEEEIRKIYRDGYKDGWNDYWNEENVGTDKSKLAPILGEAESIKAITNLLKDERDERTT